MTSVLEATCSECGAELEGVIDDGVTEVECTECGNVMELE